MKAPRHTNPSRLIAAVSLATISSVFPGLASGALAVQASADFDVSEGTYGWALGSFFIGATGLTQTGVYIGVFSAPIVTGRIIDAAGYPTMWLVVTAVGGAAAIGALAISPQFPRLPLAASEAS